MQEFEFDKTRKAIDVEKLTEEEKKMFLQKFIEKGGKVLKEKAVTKEETNNKEKKERLSKDKELGKEIQLPSQIYREKKLKEAEKIALQKSQKEILLRKASSPLILWTLRLRLWLRKITTFDGVYLKSNFMSFLNLEFKKAILELNILTAEFFSEPKFLENFKSKFPPVYLELLKRIYLLYDRKQLSDLTSEYSQTGNDIIAETIRISLFFFLRKIYILSLFKELILKILLDSVDIISSLQKKPSEIYKNKKSRLQESWKILFLETLPKLILIAQHLEKKRIEPYTQLFEEMIDLNPDEKIDPAKYTDYKNVSLVELQKFQDKNTSLTEEKKDQEQKLQDSNKEEKKQSAQEKVYHYGLKFLQLYSLEELRKRYDKKNEFKDIVLLDKIFIIFLYILFFDDQFGFLFVTNKLKLNTFFKDGVKVNLKDEMSLLYEEFRKIYGFFRRYYSDYLEYKKIKEDETINRNSLDYQKKLDYFEKRRIASARETLKVILNYIKKCEKVLILLFKDIREKKQIVVNPEDIIEFDLEEANLKLMNRKLIKDIIRDAYATSFCLIYRIENEDLKLDKIEFTQEEFDLIFGSISQNGT